MSLSACLAEDGLCLSDSDFLSKTIARINELKTASYIRHDTGWVDERTGEFFPTDECLLHWLEELEELRRKTKFYMYRLFKGCDYRYINDVDFHPYKHKASLEYVASKLGVRIDVIKCLNRIYLKADNQGVGNYTDLKAAINSRNWKRALASMLSKQLLKLSANEERFMVSVDYILARDVWRCPERISKLRNLYLSFHRL